MPKFVLAYHRGSKAENPKDPSAQRGRYMEWLEAEKDVMVSPANPMGPSKMVSENSVTDAEEPQALMGFTIIEVGNIEAAVEIAKRCPFVEMGTIQVAQLMEMKPNS
jgi:hypothetical protein